MIPYGSMSTDSIPRNYFSSYFFRTFRGREGKVLAEYKIPSVSQITSAAFGGPKLDILFVTTASRGDQPAEAGHLYRINGLDAVGTPGVKVKL